MRLFAVIVFLLTCFAETTTVTYSIQNDILTLSDGVTINFRTTCVVDQKWTVSRMVMIAHQVLSEIIVRKGGNIFVAFDDKGNLIHLKGIWDSTIKRYSYQGTANELVNDASLGTAFNLENMEIDDVELEYPDDVDFISSETFLGSTDRCNYGDTKRELQLAIATDFDFCEKYNNGNAYVSEARVFAFVAEAEAKYTPISCLVISPKYIEITCNYNLGNPFVLAMETAPNYFEGIKTVWSQILVH